MIFPKHHYINCDGNKVSVYWYEDRYRYTIDTDFCIEYRELGQAPFVEGLYSTGELELLIQEDVVNNPYGEQQLKSKCIRCSKHHGAPRREYNLAPICNRCFNALNDNYGSGTVFYSINPDGSKGSVIKEL
jgi:hypothetical protein